MRDPGPALAGLARPLRGTGCWTGHLRPLRTVRELMATLGVWAGVMFAGYVVLLVAIERVTR